MDKDKPSALQESNFYTSSDLKVPDDLKNQQGAENDPQDSEPVIIQRSPRDLSPMRKSWNSGSSGELLKGLGSSGTNGRDRDLTGQSVASAIITGQETIPETDGGAPEASADTKIVIKEQTTIEENKDVKKIEEKKAPTVNYGALFRFADGKDWFLIFFGTLFSVGNGLGMPFFSIVFGNVLNDLNQPLNKIMDSIVWDAYLFLIIGAALFICSWIGQGCFIYSSERQAKKLRQIFLQSILRQEMAWFDNHTPGELGARLVEDAKLFSKALGEKCAHFWLNFSTLIAGLIVGFVKGWQLALLVLGILPLMGAFGGLLAKTLASNQQLNLEAYSGAGSVADEAFGGIRTVQSYSGEQAEVKRYTSFLSIAKRAGYKKSFFAGISMGGMNFTMFGSYGLCLWFGTWLIRNHISNSWTGANWTGGDVMNVFFAILMGAFSLGNLGPCFEAFASGQAAGYRLFQIIDRKPSIDSLSDKGRKIDDLKGEITLQGVHFRYPTRKDVRIFEGFNLTIQPGQTVALVGQSGSGKSTIVGLLERYYDPDQGTVLVDGVDLKELNLEWWRQHVAIVSQEPVLFDGTIADNIRWGKPNATDAEVIEASKAANAHEFIDKLTLKYKSTVGSDGTLLSGGQKQRIAIARAIIKNPVLLLLDEATSALDNESERLVQLALEKIMKNRTTIVIAHRLSTIKDADVINVIFEGKIVESGSHQDLVARGGVFADLVRAQEMHELESKDEKQQEDEQPIHLEVKEEEPKETTPLKDSTPLRRTSSLKEHSLQRQSSVKSVNKSKTEKDKKEEDKEEMKEEIKSVSMMRVFQLARPDCGWMLLGFLGAAVVGVGMPIWAIIFAQITGVMYETDPAEQDRKSGFWAGIFAALGTALLLSNVSFELGFGITGERLTVKLRRMTFEALVRMEIGWFDFKNHSARVLTTRLSTDASLVQDGTTKRMGAMMQIVSTLVAGLVIAFTKSPKMAAVTLGTLPLIVVSNALQWKMMIGFTGKEQEAYAKAGAVAGEAISNIRTVHSFNGNRKILSVYATHLEGPLRLGRQTANYAGLGFGLSNFLIFAIYALCFWFGGWLIVNDGLSFPDMLAALFALVMSGFGLAQASTMMNNVAAATTAKDQIFHVLDRKPLIDGTSDEGAKDKFTNGAVSFNDVHFSYPIRPDRPVLNGLNFNIQPGETVALVGGSGCGKSTVMSLLLRFYDAEKGSILIDGVDAKAENVKMLRQQIGMVGQEPRLFDATIKENILYGKPDATDAEIIQACKMANIHDWIMTQPANYNTPCGIKGGKLSGGQKQRVAIARALVRNPKILLLDEATSALDSESEKIVQGALDKLMASKDRTVIVIAHRLSTIQNSDRIFVFDQGRVVEEGTHQSLLQKKGTYAALVKAGHSSQV